MEICFKLLIFWYDNQLVNVKWKTIISDSFKMRNGTRQGSVLSPYLFGIYIREVISHAIDSGIGCFVVSLRCNIPPRLLRSSDQCQLTHP